MDVIAQAVQITERHWEKAGERNLRRVMKGLAQKLGDQIAKGNIRREDAFMMFNEAILKLARRLEVPEARMLEIARQEIRRQR